MIELPKLPYALDALSPHISRETLEYHYGKHHQTYVTNLNNLIQNTPLQTLSLEEIILQADGSIFNNAAQVWNHSFYWNCLTPNPKPEPALSAAINRQFGSLNEFKQQFTKSALSLFGSGWTWLICNTANKLEIVNTNNAQLPLKNNQIALLTCDVWEHAYYIDYRNARPKYLENYWSLINWEFVGQQYAKCSAT